ncbi:MAG: hypothetical protein K6F39_05435 [Lachnospiraceae bacterium]|nr:hypothetical protein [Lachnospiraceae bacterium]
MSDEEIKKGENIDLVYENGEELEEREYEERRSNLKTATIPALIMLLGGAVTAIAAFVRHYPLLLMLELTFGALVVFLIIGVVVKIILDRIEIVEIVEVKRSEPEDLEGESEEEDETAFGGE